MHYYEDVETNVKGKPVFQHLTNIDAFDIEDFAKSFNLGYAQWVLAFCSISPYS